MHSSSQNVTANNHKNSVHSFLIVPLVHLAAGNPKAFHCRMWRAKLMARRSSVQLLMAT